MAFDDAREIGDRILREAGLKAGRTDTEQALRAKENLDKRLEGLGLPPTTSLPASLAPGAQRVMRPGFGGPQIAGAALVDKILGLAPGASPAGAIAFGLVDPPGLGPPRVIPAADSSDMSEMSDAVFEPFDLIAAQAVTGLGLTSAGGTEVKFNIRGFVHVGSGAIGAYWNRALGANQNFRWAPLAPNLLIPYDPRQGLFIGQNSAGGITPGGVLTLAFYRLPPIRPRVRRDPREKPPSGPGTGGDAGDRDRFGGGSDYADRVYDGMPGSGFSSVQEFRRELQSRLSASGSDNPAGAIVAGVGGGDDVTLGTFSDAGVGTQIYSASSNLPVGGAIVPGSAILNSSPANSDIIWVGESLALAVASNGPLGPSGQDTWNIPLGGKLFMLANSGTQVLGVRFRS